MIPNKAAYIDDETWSKLVKVVAPAIRKTKLRNVAYVLSILFSIYMPTNICPYNTGGKADGEFLGFSQIAKFLVCVEPSTKLHI